MLKNVLLITIFLLVAAPAWADLDFEDAAFPEFATSARALAMGNAYICKVDDSWSAFYNPAGLGTVRKPSFHLFNMHLESSTTYMNAVGGGPASDIPGNVSDSFDVEKMRDMLVKHEGKLSSMRANFFPNFTIRGMTLGYLFSQRNRAIIEKESDGGEYEVAERRDHGPVFALNLPLFGGIFKVGATAAYVFRRELYKEFASTDAVEIDKDEDFRKGRGLFLTTGARLTLPVAALPTVSAVLRNATQNNWEGTSGKHPDYPDQKDKEGPEKLRQTIDVGVSITPQISKVTRLHMEVNFKDLNDAYDTDSKRRMAAGMELDFNRRIFIRAGYGDGWGSGGIGVRSRTFIFDFTTYAVDRSRDGFREEEDRRFVLSVSSGI